MNDKEENSECRPGYGYGDLNATDKEKIKEALEFIDSYLADKDDDELDNGMKDNLRDVLKGVKNFLE